MNYQPLYVCDQCGGNTFERGVSLPGDNCGTKTRCVECHNKIKYPKMPKAIEGKIPPLIGKDGSEY